MLNIVIPMAGRGSRFSSAGYDMPKPLIQVMGQPMIRLVIENLRPARPHKFIFICQQEHREKYAVDSLLRSVCPGSEIVFIDEVTEGAACTVLAASQYIDNGAPIMIANSDQWINASIDEYLTKSDESALDGLIMTMYEDNPKWSYVKLDEAGYALEVAEKRVISNNATVGIYSFRHGADFVMGANEMIRKAKRVNGEFYVAPVYNELIHQGQRIGAHSIGGIGTGMFGLGTPEDLEFFLKTDESRAALDCINKRNQILNTNML